MVDNRSYMFHEDQVAGTRAERDGQMCPLDVG